MRAPRGAIPKIRARARAQRLAMRRLAVAIGEAFDADASPEAIEAFLAEHLARLAETSWRSWLRAVPRRKGRAVPADPDFAAAVERPLKGKPWRERVREHALQQRIGAASEAQVRARLQTLAKTEALRLDAWARDRATVARLGRDGVKGWRYTTMRDERVRPEHRKREGRVFLRGEPRIALPDGYNCRCVYVPLV